MKKTKVLTSIIIGMIFLILIVAGVWGYKTYQLKHLVVNVQPVYNINWGYWGDTESSYGMVTSDSAQEIYLSDTDSVLEVHVKEGDFVEIGDLLISYDTSELSINIARKKLEIDTVDNDITLANYKLNSLKNATPVDKTAPQIDENKLAELEAQDEINNSISETDEENSRIYNYLTAESIPFNATIDSATGDVIYPAGTVDEPYIYYCNENAFAYGSFYNAIRSSEDGSGKYVVIYVGDESGEKIVLDGNTLPTSYDEECMWYLITGDERFPSNLAQEYMDEFINNSMDWTEPEGYTQQELVEEIADTEKLLKDLDIKKRKLLLELESLEQISSDGSVYATVAGEVKTVGDVEFPPTDGTAFLVVMGDEGLYVNGTISELLLEDVTIGTVVTANAWESGMTFEATITEISDFPTTGNSWSEGNPNVSYYSYTAYIEDSSGLRNGEYVDLSISINQNVYEGIYIEKAYVREENGRSYCMIADENGNLKKQYVVTGKTVYGSAVEIKSGLTNEDLIAFPYGKEVVEGATVTESTDIYY